MNAMNDPELIRVLTRIEEKLTNLENIYKDHLQEHTDHETRIRTLENYSTSDHGIRIRALEKRVWQLPSAAFLLSVLGAVLSYFAGK